MKLQEQFEFQFQYSILYQKKIQNLLRKGMKIDLVFMVVVQKTDWAKKYMCSTQLMGKVRHFAGV